MVIWTLEGGWIQHLDNPGKYCNILRFVTIILYCPVETVRPVKILVPFCACWRFEQKLDLTALLTIAFSRMRFLATDCNWLNITRLTCCSFNRPYQSVCLEKSRLRGLEMIGKTNKNGILSAWLINLRVKLGLVSSLISNEDSDWMTMRKLTSAELISKRFYWWASSERASIYIRTWSSSRSISKGDRIIIIWLFHFSSQSSINSIAMAPKIAIIFYSMFAVIFRR